MNSKWNLFIVFILGVIFGIVVRYLIFWIQDNISIIFIQGLIII